MHNWTYVHALRVVCIPLSFLSHSIFHEIEIQEKKRRTKCTANLKQDIFVYTAISAVYTRLIVFIRT